MYLFVYTFVRVCVFSESVRVHMKLAAINDIYKPFIFILSNNSNWNIAFIICCCGSCCKTWKLLITRLQEFLCYCCCGRCCHVVVVVFFVFFLFSLLLMMLSFSYCCYSSSCRRSSYTIVVVVVVSLIVGVIAGLVLVVLVVACRHYVFCYQTIKKCYRLFYWQHSCAEIYFYLVLFNEETWSWFVLC